MSISALAAALLLMCGAAAGFGPLNGLGKNRCLAAGRSMATTRMHMVRNIDLPECLVFYGLHESFLSQGHVEPDVVSLLNECHDTDTAVVVIPEYQDSNQEEPTPPSYSHLSPVHIYHFHPKAPAPNPLDLYNALNSITIEPRPFGGSAGFGAKQYTDPERVPLAARTVVLCQSLDQTRAARYCGMRALCWEDNDLADAIIDTVDFYLDDIATPGSFWLNPPPGPRDDDGNKVDLEEVMEYYSQIKEERQDTLEEAARQQEGDVGNNDDLSDEELQSILADMSSL